MIPTDLNLCGAYEELIILGAISFASLLLLLLMDVLCHIKGETTQASQNSSTKPVEKKTN